MPEPLREQIDQKLLSVLGGIIGDAGVTYWHTVDTAVRVELSSDIELSRDHGPVIHILRPGETENEQRASGGTLEAKAEYWLTVASTYEPSSRDPYADLSPNPPATQIQNRLIADAQKALAGWAQFGLGITNLKISDEERDTPEDGWAAVNLRLEVTHEFRQGAP